MTPETAFAAFFVASAILLVGYEWRGDRAPLSERIVTLASGVALAALVGWVAFLWQERSRFNWSDGRSLPAEVMLREPAKLYVGADGDPVLSAMYPPLAWLPYLPLTIVHDVDLRMRWGALASLFVVFAPSAWLLLRPTAGAGNAWRAGLPALACFGAIVASTLSLAYSATTVHADAPAIGLGVLACRLATADPNKWSLTRLLGISLAGASAVWAKQTMIGLPAGLMVWTCSSAGWRPTAQLASGLLAGGLGLGLLFGAMFGWRELAFNVFEVPSRQPLYGPIASELARALNAEAIVLAPSLLALAGYGFLVTRESSDYRRDWRRSPVCLLLVVGVCLLPLSALGRSKVGGDINCYSMSAIFIVLSACLAIRDELVEPAFARARPILCAALALLLMAFGATRAWDYHHMIQEARLKPASEASVAYDFLVRHPGIAYFSKFPLCHYLAEGRLVHFESGLYERELAGFPVEGDQLRRGLPPDAIYLAFPPSWERELAYDRFLARTDVDRRSNMKPLFEMFPRRVELRELPGWMCWRRVDAPVDAPAKHETNLPAPPATSPRAK